MQAIIDPTCCKETLLRMLMCVPPPPLLHWSMKVHWTSASGQAAPCLKLSKQAFHVCCLFHSGRSPNLVRCGCQLSLFLAWISAYYHSTSTTPTTTAAAVLLLVALYFSHSYSYSCSTSYSCSSYSSFCYSSSSMVLLSARGNQSTAQLPACN